MAASRPSGHPQSSWQKPDGTERHRYVGYLPAEDFLAQLELGLAKAAFSRGQFDAAQRAFRDLVSRYAKTEAAPEAIYWSAVSAYKASGKPEFLKQGGAELQQKYPQSDWAKKGSLWSDWPVITIGLPLPGAGQTRFEQSEAISHKSAKEYTSARGLT